ncbi:SPOR domain-containing protein [Neobacillus niacini]|uniref:SPOR domain-containing protein n=1 Tax=Neobacillus niacini TaxID=86668 RepID=UPI0021CB1030|nr:SPOR domain-containing protein [Neobacillus niacini]MCM3765446.1 SPOR domain-containing protein [Neobacillus niacini]
MDKPKNGHTITIKLNGDNKKFKEERQNSEPEPIIEPIPRVIKIDPVLSESDTKEETAAAQESVDESFDWIIPESSEDDMEAYKIVPPKSPKKSSNKIITSFSFKNKKKPNWPITQIISTVVFAVLIGTTIGVFMYKLVFTESTINPASLPAVVEEEQDDKKGEPGSKDSKAVTAAVPELSTYMIQGGVFSSEEGASETLNEVKESGIPAQIIQMDGKHYLFFGVADSIETAKSIGTQYKGNGVDDAFAKPLLIKEKQISELSESEKSFIETIPTIYQTLSNATSGAITSKSISEETTKALMGIEAQLKANGLKNDNVKKLNAELTSANDKVKAYQKSKNKKDLSEAQQHLLNFLSVYYSM